MIDTYLRSLTRTALDHPSVKSAHFWRGLGGRAHGVAYAGSVGIEFDVRETEDGWNVNDDKGRDFVQPTLAAALSQAIEWNEGDE